MCSGELNRIGSHRQANWCEWLSIHSIDFPLCDSFSLSISLFQLLSLTFAHPFIILVDCFSVLSHFNYRRSPITFFVILFSSYAGAVSLFFSFSVSSWPLLGTAHRKRSICKSIRIRRLISVIRFRMNGDENMRKRLCCPSF